MITPVVMAGGSGNATARDVMLPDARNSFSKADEKLVAVVGLDVVVVVSTKNAALVGQTDRVQKAKVIAFLLRQ